MFVFYVSALASLQVISCEIFVIPDVEIKVLEPKGFSVSIPDQDGINLFGFHGNINRELENYDMGQYHKDVKKPNNGKWTYENRKVKLKKNDLLYYWIFVQHKKLGYRKDVQTYKLEGSEDVEEDEEEIINPHKTTTETIITPIRPLIPDEPQEPIKPTRPITPPKVDDESCIYISNKSLYEQNVSCEETLISFSKKVFYLEKKVEEINQINDILKEIVKVKTEKKLTMKGHISQDDSPVSVVQFILYEKLNLKPSIVSAERNEDQSITFELSTLAEMLTILQVARDKLHDSRVISITY